jgi:hypothetical protein
MGDFEDIGKDEKAQKGKKEPIRNDSVKEAETRLDVLALAGQMNLAAWERAGLFKAAGWAPGKQVSLSVFTAALEGFRERRQGGGRINV